MMWHPLKRVTDNNRTGQTMLLGILLLGFSLTAQAVPIDGEIGFTGSFTPLDDANQATTLDAATGIDFYNDQAFVLNASGDFSGIADFTLASFSDFQFDETPVSPLWSVGGFSFELSSVSVDLQTTSALELSGSGTVSGNGFDDTAGTWSFSGDSTGLVFAWSGGTIAEDVAAPPMLWLWGAGLLGMIGASRTKVLLARGHKQ